MLYDGHLGQLLAIQFAALHKTDELSWPHREISYNEEIPAPILDHHAANLLDTDVTLVDASSWPAIGVAVEIYGNDTRGISALK